jgi:hypothetical protein
MKKIIGMVIASLVFGNIGFAEIREIEDGSLRIRDHTTSRVVTVSVDGYKFVVVRGTRAISVTQFHEERNGKSLPAKC